VEKRGKGGGNRERDEGEMELWGEEEMEVRIKKQWEK